MNDSDALTTADVRLRLKHLLLAVAGAGVLFAIVGAINQEASTRGRLWAMGQSVAFVFMVLASVGFVFHQRQRAQRDAGRLLGRFARGRSRLVNWLVVVMFLSWFAFDAALGWTKAKPGEIVNVLPSPVLIWLFTNYVVVRLWWKIDPMTLEVFEGGLIQGGWKFCPWSSVQRYTWSGKQQNQLNLYLKQRVVGSIKMEQAGRDELDRLLAQHVPGHSAGKIAPNSAAAAATIAR